MPWVAAVAVSAALAAAQSEHASHSQKYTKVKDKEFHCKNCGAPEIGTECQYCKTIFHQGNR